MGSDSKASKFWKDEPDAKNDNPKELKIKQIKHICKQNEDQNEYLSEK